MRPLRFISKGFSALLIGAVTAYRKVVSPIMPRVCRFEPTCSQYMIDAIRKKGPVVGVLKGLWRLLRCNPFVKGGYDPVE